MSDTTFQIILRAPKYPIIIVSADKLYSAFNIEQLAKACINSIPLMEANIVKAIDSEGREFWYSVDKYVFSPSFLGNKWTKKQIIEIYNANRSISNNGNEYSLKSLSNKKVTDIVRELCNRLKN